MQAVAKIGPPVSENEEYLLVAFRRGDHDAFRQVYDRMYKSLYYFVNNIINSSFDAEDLVATAFLKLFDVRASMQSFDHIRRWLFVIVRNQAIDYLRAKRKSREASRQINYMDKEGDEFVDLELLKTTLLQSLADEVEKLPRQRKAILRLYFFEQKTTVEIANLLGLSPQTVLNHKTRALDALRKTFLRPEWLEPGILLLMLALPFSL